MKTILTLMLLVSAAMLIAVAAEAHTPTQHCSQPGWITYSWTAYGQSRTVAISYGHDYDTVEMLPNTTFQAQPGQKVHFKFADGYELDLIAGPIHCTLPVALDHFTFSNGTFEWETLSESNSKSFTIEQNDGSGWYQVITVPTKAKAGDSDAAILYRWKVGTPYQGGLDLGLLFVIVVCMYLFAKRRWIIAVIAAALIMASTGCSKSNDKPSATPDASGGSYYRLSHQDNDGNIQYSNVIQ